MLFFDTFCMQEPMNLAGLLELSRHPEIIEVAEALHCSILSAYEQFEKQQYEEFTQHYKCTN